MFNPHASRGVTLIELMIAVGIIGIIAAVAVPLVTGYVSTSRTAVMRENIQTIRLFQDEYRLRRRTFVEGTYDPANPDASGGLKDILGWEPRTEVDTITYVVSCEADGTDPECTRASGYTVTATNSLYPDEPVCVGFGGASC